MYIGEEFKKSIMENGRQISVKIQYDDVVLNKESIISCKKSFKGDMFKSIIQYVDIEIEGIHELKGKEVSVSFGVKYDKDDYEYIDWGTFIVDTESVENVIANNSTKFTAYDYLYKSHISYDLSIAYPITVKGYLEEICKKLGYNLMTNEFVNMDKTIDEDKYIDVYDNTYRDVLDEIAGSVGAAICMKQNNLYIKYPTHTNYVLDENNLSSLKLSKKFGPINSLILSLDPQEDNLYRYDNISISENGKTEIKITNNEIMNKKRETFIDNLFHKISGLYFFPFELDSFGYGYLEPYDIVTIKDLKGIEYPCLLLNGTSSVTTGFTESLSCVIPETAETDYSKATQSKKLLYQTILTVDKQKQTIDGVVKQQEENVEDISHLQISIGEIKTEVSKTSESIYKFETGSGNIFDNCNQYIKKDNTDLEKIVSSDMPLGIDKNYMRGKDICISVDVNIKNAIIDETLENYVGAEFTVKYVDNTLQTYKTRWYLGQYPLQYILTTSTCDVDKRIYEHFMIEDKEILDVYNLKITIDLNASKAIVAYPKVEFGVYPTGFEFDIPYIRDNIMTIQKDYTNISQTVNDLSLQAVSMEEQITNIKGETSSLTTRLQSTEIKLQPTNILLAVNEKIGSDGTLYTTKFILDKNGGHFYGGGIDISNNNGSRVFYADINGNLIINNLTAINGTFSGIINSTMGNIAGFLLGAGGFTKTSTKTLKKVYTQSDSTRVRDIIVGNIQPTQNDYYLYDTNGDGKITAVDYLKIEQMYIPAKSATIYTDVIINSVPYDDSDINAPLVLVRYRGGNGDTIAQSYLSARTLETVYIKCANINASSGTFNILSTNSSSSDFNFIGNQTFFNCINDESWQGGNIWAEYYAGTSNFYIEAQNLGYLTFGISTERLYLRPQSGNYSAFFSPRSNGLCTLGDTSHRFYRLYSRYSEDATSDRRQKKDFKEFDKRYIRLVEMLIPTFYRFNEQTDNQGLQAGFIAQDVLAAMKKCGIDKKEFGVVKHSKWKDEKTNEEKDEYSLVYAMFIPLLTYYIQFKNKNYDERIIKLENLFQKRRVK